jgi:hypothetical protein
METRPSKNKEMGKGCLSSIFSMGLFLLIGLGLSFWGWTILQNARASASWPIADGRVTNSEVNHTTDAEGGDSYSPEITYTYAVNDTNLNNSTIKFGENSYSSRKKAEEILSNYPVGKNVTVYYDPEKPDRSVLEPGVSAGSFIVLGIGVFFILITLAILPISFFLRNRG